jgi:hypothetical protein
MREISRHGRSGPAVSWEHTDGMTKPPPSVTVKACLWCPRGDTVHTHTPTAADHDPLPVTGHFRWEAQVGEDESGEHLRDQELVGDRLVVSAGSTTSPQA